MAKKKQTNVVDITPQDVNNQSFFNTLSHTLRRFSGALFGESPDGARDYKETFGYLDSISYADNYGMYTRGGIASTVVDKVAKACWRDVPEIKLNDENILEAELKRLKKVGLFNAFERADILNRIGRLSVLFIGVQDGLEFNQPLGSGGTIEDLYFRVYSEDGIEINKWDIDPASPRYGLPEIYQLKTSTLTENTGKSVGTQTINVHWTRVVHLAEGALQNPVEGRSALEPVWNALIDKDKVRGSGAESYYRNARQKFGLMADKEAGFATDDAAKAKLDNEIKAFTDGWQDFMRLKNMDIKAFQPGIGSPRDAYDICIEEIAGQTGIPVRVLTGKGGGQLAGTEDKAAWNALVLDRQDLICTGWLGAALGVIIAAGMMNPLPDDCETEWPEQSALTEKEKAEVNDIKAATIQKIAAARSVPGGDEIELESTLSTLDLEDIEIDDSDLGDIGDEQ